MEIKVRELLLYGECVVEIKLAKKTKRIKIKMPKELISPLSHKKMLYRISKIRSDLPEYTKREKLKDSIAEGFDIRKYDLDRKKAIMAITTRWGGIPRVDIMSMTTSYQYIVGYLRTKYVELIISEHLVKELNVILKKNNFRNRIRLDAKYSSREILDAIEKLYSGKVNMSYALDFR
ncbi:hypothetical protein IKF74_01010 [Candidatus Saccharibacteria bacterium]|nr:hypothetical protein [Candidatus Saccharibacteria bacterium]